MTSSRFESGIQFMKNFKLTIEYDGATFKGWQRQGQGERTVQGELEKTLAKIFKSDHVTTVASGRTDSGVHALGQVVHVKADTRMKAGDLFSALNAWLPKDIAVSHVKEVSLDFHAQYSVKNKTYRYLILNREYPSVWMRERSLFYPHQVNVTLMRKAAKVLVGKHDFKSLQAFDVLRAEKNTVRTIKSCVIKKDQDWLSVEVTADGFLYKMVRNIVGVLLAAGRGQMTAQDIQDLLKKKDRNQAPNTAPAHGLTLVKVIYKNN